MNHASVNYINLRRNNLSANLIQDVLFRLENNQLNELLSINIADNDEISDDDLNPLKDYFRNPNLTKENILKRPYYMPLGKKLMDNSSFANQLTNFIVPNDLSLKNNLKWSIETFINYITKYDDKPISINIKPICKTINLNDREIDLYIPNFSGLITKWKSFDAEFNGLINASFASFLATGVTLSTVELETLLALSTGGIGIGIAVVALIVGFYLDHEKSKVRTEVLMMINEARNFLHKHDFNKLDPKDVIELTRLFNKFENKEYLPRNIRDKFLSIEKDKINTNLIYLYEHVYYEYKLILNIILSKYNQLKIPDRLTFDQYYFCNVTNDPIVNYKNPRSHFASFIYHSTLLVMQKQENKSLCSTLFSRLTAINNQQFSQALESILIQKYGVTF